MSLEQAIAFRKKAESDSQLQEAVVRAFEAGADQAVVELGAKHGFQFSREELIGSIQNSELTSFELDMVAGGSLMGTAIGTAAAECARPDMNLNFRTSMPSFTP